MSRVNTEFLWAGTEQSLQVSLAADEAAQKNLQAGAFQARSDEEKEPNRLLSVTEGVAVISIKGPLVNDGDAWWNEMTGRTGYPEIRDALLDAANDQDVTDILLDIDSGGGQVAGVADTGKLIRLINDSVKPVTAFTDGDMMSAAYWLGSSAGKVYGTTASMSGSIGVISTHMERSKMLSEMGIGVTVVRSGPFKGLVNSVEPLSAEGKAQLQMMVDAANSVFVTHVSEMRNTPYATVDNVMGGGRVFIAAEALKVGLIDGVSSFDTLVGDLKKKALDRASARLDNRAKSATPLNGLFDKTQLGAQDMSKKALTEQQVAILAAGGTLPELNASTDADSLAAKAEVDAKAEAEAKAKAEADAKAEAEAKAKAEAEAKAKAEADAKAAEEAEKVANSSATVQLLNSQLAAKDAQLLEAGIKMAKLNDQLQEANATHGPLLDIAVKSINTMQVALGGTALDMKGLTAVQVLAEHTRLSEQFASKFKVGGVASVPAADKKSGAAPAGPAHMARVNAARHSATK